MLREKKTTYTWMRLCGQQNQSCLWQGRETLVTETHFVQMTIQMLKKIRDLFYGFYHKGQVNCKWWEKTPGDKSINQTILALYTLIDPTIEDSIILRINQNTNTKYLIPRLICLRWCVILCNIDISCRKIDFCARIDCLFRVISTPYGSFYAEI